MQNGDQNFFRPGKWRDDDLNKSDDTDTDTEQRSKRERRRSKRSGKHSSGSETESANSSTASRSALKGSRQLVGSETDEDLIIIESDDEEIKEKKKRCKVVKRVLQALRQEEGEFAAESIKEAESRLNMLKHEITNAQSPAVRIATFTRLKTTRAAALKQAIEDEKACQVALENATKKREEISTLLEVALSKLAIAEEDQKKVLQLSVPENLHLTRSQLTALKNATAEEAKEIIAGLQRLQKLMKDESEHLLYSPSSPKEDEDEEMLKGSGLNSPSRNVYPEVDPFPDLTGDTSPTIKSTLESIRAKREQDLILTPPHQKRRNFRNRDREPRDRDNSRTPDRGEGTKRTSGDEEATKVEQPFANGEETAADDWAASWTPNNDV